MKESKESIEKEKRLFVPSIGVPFSLAQSILIGVNRCCAKILFENHPTMTSSQLIFYRSILAMIGLIIFVNKNLKAQMFDSLRRDLIGNLILKVSLSSIGVFISYAAVKYFSLTINAVARNLAPFVALILSTFCLLERPSMNQVI